MKRAWLGAEKRSEPPNPGLGNTAHEDIGKRCRCLPFPCGRYADTVYEIQVKVSVGSEGEEVVVKLRRHARSDGYFRRLSCAGGYKFARPTDGNNQQKSHFGEHRVCLTGFYPSSSSVFDMEKDF